MLLAEKEPSKIRLADFYEAAIDAQLPQPTRLAANLVAGDLVALTENITNARTEGFNRVIQTN
jgi:hypothetical protein